MLLPVGRVVVGSQSPTWPLGQVSHLAAREPCLSSPPIVYRIGSPLVPLDVRKDVEMAKSTCKTQSQRNQTVQGQSGISIVQKTFGRCLITGTFFLPEYLAGPMLHGTRIWNTVPQPPLNTESQLRGKREKAGNQRGWRFRARGAREHQTRAQNQDVFILEVGLAGLTDGGSSHSKIFGLETNRVYLCLIPGGPVGEGGLLSPKQSFCLPETRDPYVLTVTEGTGDFGLL